MAEQQNDFQVTQEQTQQSAPPSIQPLGGDSGVDLPAALPWWKRALDLGAILVLAPGILLIAGAIAIWIKFGSKGTVLFRQERVGHKGRHFTCYKFRTMRPGAETRVHESHVARLMASNQPMVKLDDGDDSRLIPAGRVLRASGLDELPQLLNVIRGEMSLVGPRPCIPYECNKYEPWHWRRFDAVPGLTGLWQVSGKNRTTFDEMVRFDITYALKKSLWLDLKIIALTPLAIGSQFLDLLAARRKKAETSEQTTRTPVAKLRQSVPLFDYES